MSVRLGNSFDPDAASYFLRIAAAGSSISPSNAVAVDAFIKGCKADGIWSAIKASCILAGADTLAGALVPLVGPAPTNVGGLFVSGDYSRTLGLDGNGTTKYLDAGVMNNSLNINSKHFSVWMTRHHSRDKNRSPIGTSNAQVALFTNASNRYFMLNGGFALGDTSTNIGFYGASRISSSQTSGRYNGVTTTQNVASTLYSDLPIWVFRGNDYADARISFYSIGENIDLAKLDSRLTTLMASLT